jgi:protein O-mannosyl-transferase
MKSRKSAQPLVPVMISLVFVVALAFGQAVGYGFVHYDDNAYVFRNPHVIEGLSAGSIRWALTTTENSLWLPLTRLSYLIDSSLSDMKPGWFHFVNILLHTLSTLILFRLLHALTGALWRSAGASALFAIHPLRVESVVWVTERKDVLAMCLVLLSLAMYVWYVRTRSRTSYAGSVALFLGSLMAKPMAAAFPVLLLILDWWPLNRLSGDAAAQSANGSSKKSATHRTFHPRRALLEAIPYFIISGTITLLTVIANRGALMPDELIALPTRLANAATAYLRYLIDIAWPSGLAFYYPYNPQWLTLPAVAASVTVLGLITAAVIVFRTRAPWLAMGWFWYLIALLPVIGIVQAGSQSLADRFTYLPSIGISISVVWGISAIMDRFMLKPAIRWAVFGVVSVCLLTATIVQTRVWRDSETLFTRAREVTSDNYVAALNLANLYLSQNRPADAVPLYREALTINPDSGAAHFNMGTIMLNSGKFEEAVAHYSRALKTMQDNPFLHRNLAQALSRLGRTDEAMVHLKEAERLVQNQRNTAR